MIIQKSHILISHILELVFCYVLWVLLVLDWKFANRTTADKFSGKRSLKDWTIEAYNKYLGAQFVILSVHCDRLLTDCESPPDLLLYRLGIDRETRSRRRVVVDGEIVGDKEVSVLIIHQSR